MIYEPHDYQKYAINFIKENPIAAVLLDMGLGKTSITLTAINDLLFDSFDVRKVIVIAPLRVARDTWIAEVDKWDHLRHLICSVAVGTEVERKAALRKKAHIYIINRENVSWLIEESGIPFDFDMVVIDELSSFKNGKAKRFKSLLKVRPLIKRIVGLTGTPAGNGLMDLWAEFRVLDMGKRLGRFISNYRLNYFTPDKRNGQIVYSYKPLPFAEQAIYVNNARTHSPEQINKLRSSLREFGFINPVIIDRDYGVIAGHGRILAAKEEGISEVPCVFADHLTEAQKKAYIIADNRMAMDAGWDEELLRVEIESLQAADFDPLLTGFDEKELSKLFDDGIEAEEDDFDVDAELQKPTFTKSGDIWTLGRHRLICGDSTKEETYTALMDSRKANLVITDPPYNVNYEGSAGKIKNDNMASEKFFDFLFDAFSNMEKVMADDASIYVFHADTEGLNFRKAFDAAGFYLSGCCIWKKQSLVLGRSPYQWQHEPCLYGWKKKGKHQWYTGRKESTIWEFDKPKKNGDHPTMKPIALLAYPIQNSSMANSVVLDPFGGSGSTLIACEQTDRICCTIELDEKFCDVIVRRYIEQVGTDEKVSVLRDGKEYKFSEVAPHDE